MHRCPRTLWARRTPGLIRASPSFPWQATIGDFAARVQRPSRRAGAPAREYIARPLRGGTGAGGSEGSSEGEQDLFAGTDRAWEVPGGSADLARRFAEAEEQSKRDSQARAPPRPHRLSPSPRPRSSGWASCAQRHLARRRHRAGRAEEVESEDETRDAPEQSFVRLSPWDRDRAAFVAGARPRPPRG